MCIDIISTMEQNDYTIFYGKIIVFNYIKIRHTLKIIYARVCVCVVTLSHAVFFINNPNKSDNNL